MQSLFPSIKQVFEERDAVKASLERYKRKVELLEKKRLAEEKKQAVSAVGSGNLEVAAKKGVADVLPASKSMAVSSSRAQNELSRILLDLMTLEGMRDPKFKGLAARVSAHMDSKYVDAYFAGFEEKAFFDYLRGGASLLESMERLCRDPLFKGTSRFTSLIATLLRNAETRNVANVGAVVMAERDGLYTYVLSLCAALPVAVRDRHVFPEYLRALLSTKSAKSKVAAALETSKTVSFADTRAALKTYKVLYAFGHFELSTALLARVRAEAAREGLDVAIFDAEIKWQERFTELCNQKIEFHDSAARPAIPRIAIIDYKQADYSKVSSNVGDYTQTIALMGNLARHSNIEFVGDSALVDVFGKLKERLAPSRKLGEDKEPRQIQVTMIDRDASSVTPPPVNTWMFAFGWYMHPSFDDRLDFPFHENINPIFISFHCNNLDLINDEYADYLRRHGPIGCRDWTTVYLLRSKGVPAFFSGCITSTLDNIFAACGDAAEAGETVFVDAKKPRQDGRTSLIQAREHVRWNDPVTNLHESIEMIESYATKYAKIVTSRLHSFIPATAIGAEVEFVPRNPSDVRFEGLLHLNRENIAQIRTPILRKVQKVVSMIADGRGRGEIYRAWARMCKDDVDAAEHYATQIRDVSMRQEDVAALVSSASRLNVHGKPRGDADVINLAIATDAAMAPYVSTLLASIARNTSHALHVFALTRGLDDEALYGISQETDRKSGRALPIDFVKCDHIDYGDIKGMLKHISVSTMDRLILSDLLPDLQKIIYLDIDMLVLGDVADLWNFDLQGAPFAARKSLARGYSKLHRHVFRAAVRLEPAKAWDLRRRALLSHDLSCETFNAGLLVLDLDRLRIDRFCCNYLGYVREFGLNDQEVLNIYSGAAWTHLPEGWNSFVRQEDTANSKLLHWVGPNKPWGRELTLEQDRWKQYFAL